MRFREQQLIIDENINNLTIDSDKLNDGSIVIKNTLKLTKAISNISIIGAFDTEISNLLNQGFSMTPIGNIVVQQNLINFFISNVTTIKNKALAIKSSLDLSLPKQDENSITIGLPDYTDLSKIDDVISDLTNSLEMICSVDSYRSKVKVQNFDSGSLWLEVKLDNFAAISFLAFIIKTSLSLVSQYMGIKAQKKSLESMDYDSQVKQNLTKSMEEIFNFQVRQTLENANKNEEKGIDNEDLTKLTKVVFTITKLLGEGTTFTPAKLENNNEKIDFPSIEMIKSLTEQKLIDHSEDTID